MVCVRERKLRYVGHIVRGEIYEIFRLVTEVKIAGKTPDLFGAAVSNAVIAKLVAKP